MSLVLFGENVLVVPGSVRKQGNPKSPDADGWTQELANTVKRLNLYLRVPKVAKKVEVRWADNADMANQLSRILHSPTNRPDDEGKEDVRRFLRHELPYPNGYYVGEASPRVLIYEDAPNYCFTLAHELGHFVDAVLLAMSSKPH